MPAAMACMACCASRPRTIGSTIACDGSYSTCTCGLLAPPVKAAVACAPKPAGRVSAARCRPASTCARAVSGAASVTARALSARRLASTRCETALRSWSDTTTGMRLGLSLPLPPLLPPNRLPKKAAMRIGATMLMITARRLLKCSVRSLSSRAMKACMVGFLGSRFSRAAGGR